MNIFYNFELDDNLLVVKKKPESMFLFSDFRQGIIDRLKVLKEEIDAEENDGEKMIVIIWPINPEKVPLGIQCYYYSENLTKKIKNSLSNDYIQSLFKIISDKFDTFNQ